MNIKTAILWATVWPLICGCKERQTKADDYRPLENGFEMGQYSVETYPGHHAPGLSLLFHDPNGKRTPVWPYLLIIWGNNLVIKSNMVVLVGGKAELDNDGTEALTKRLIGFESPEGPPLDITDQIIQKYSLKSGVKPSDVVKDSFNTITNTNDSVYLEFVILKHDLRGPGSIDAADGAEVISWDEIKAIMQDVKKNGELKREKWSGIEYLQKE